MEYIRRTVEELRDLPTLPKVALEVRRIVSDPKSSMTDLMEVISKDPPISSRVLRIANSAYLGVPRKIDNLRTALVILGTKEISNLVMTITILRLFPASESGGIDITKFWTHSAACAEVTAGLYEGLRLPVPASAYFAGLLHDIGKIILYQYFHEYHVKCHQLAQKANISAVEAELQVIGVDHGHIGGWLTQRWNLPDEISRAVSQHHLRPVDVAPFSLPVMVHWANRLAHLFEQNQPAEVASFLQSDREWLNWYPTTAISTAELVVKLKQNLDRSLTIVTLLS